MLGRLAVQSTSAKQNCATFVPQLYRNWYVLVAIAKSPKAPKTHARVAICDIESYHVL